ncbi:dienelactone hydrolase family protein [Kibdelosporangium philippinense]|uniref:Dienelactone hydrolase family protein n=1 Tax=Kibdelosporangium philippinense TaxID=211113 RepID=A0ABS8ZD76_9PSEU|nr:dienelactone hydrolase family protein [Kibdelosporangium philippinense]MCE7005794.1 dienelactone hydrolase family protein [Kibdelosporangium philippinense]
MARAKQLAYELALPGPHSVLRGDLGLAGQPGVLFTPTSGHGLPAIAFGHGWLQPPLRYHGLLRHLATHGIVVAAPSTHTGPLGSHRLFAADLLAALKTLVSVQLGDGQVKVSPDRLGLAGHCFGGGSAVLAAAEDSRIRAVATLAAAESRPSAVDAARHCRMPGLYLTAGLDLVAPPVGNAELIARWWAGPVQVRELPKAGHLGFTEGRHWSQLLLAGKGERKTQRISRALLTAFFLKHLTGTDAYDELLDNDIKGAKILESPVLHPGV